MSEQEKRSMVLGHLGLIEQGLGHLKSGIECALTLPPNGVIIHKDHTLEVIKSIAISAWACKDLLKHSE